MTSIHSRLLLPAACAFAAAAALPAQSFVNGLQFTGSDAAAGDLLGSAVDIHGGQTVFGAFGHDHAGVQTTGGAWIREQQPNGTWIETAKLVPADVATQDQFGYAVAITTNRALVGSRFDDDLGSSSGGAYVFEKQLDGSWQETAKLLPSDGGPGQEFGLAVDIDGDYAVVGAPDGNGGVTNSGTAYVFERQSDASWVQVAELLQNDAGNNDDFGWTVSISGTRVAVGAYLDDDNGAASGSAYVFEQQPDGTWPQVAKLLPSGGSSADYFGFSVAVSGSRVVAGAWLDDDNGSGSGSAYVFEEQPDGSWIETFKMLPPSQWAGAHFGQAVALDGDVALIGAIHDRVGGQSNAGSATLFRRLNDGTWGMGGQIDNPNPDRNDNFAHDIAISGAGAIIGTSQEDSFGSEAGAVQLFFTYGGYGVPIFQGTGTAGCNGPHGLSSSSQAFLGNPGFALIDQNAPPSGLGLLLIGDVGNPVGSDPLGLGALLHVDVLQSAAVLSAPIVADASGTGTAPLPIPNDPNLIGVVLHAQALWTWPACGALPNGVSSSNLASFAIIQP